MDIMMEDLKKYLIVRSEIWGWDITILPLGIWNTCLPCSHLIEAIQTWSWIIYNWICHYWIFVDTFYGFRSDLNIYPTDFSNNFMKEWGYIIWFFKPGMEVTFLNNIRYTLVTCDKTGTFEIIDPFANKMRFTFTFIRADCIKIEIMFYMN